MLRGSPAVRWAGPLARATARGVSGARRIAAIVRFRPAGRGPFGARAEAMAAPWRRLFGKLTRNRNSSHLASSAMTLTFDAVPAPPVSLARSDVLATAGTLSVRLAVDGDDVAAAQALRYRVFYEEMSARPTEEMRALRRDFDAFDLICDILLVEDAAREPGDQVVGTYRLLRQEVAERNGGFYSEAEYDLSPIRPLFTRERQALELGRSCVDRSYRNNATIHLLWRGIASYVGRHRIGWMFGCASLHGTDPDVLAPQLSFLYHNCLAPEDRRARAVPERHVEMNRLPADRLENRRVLQSLPPLVKGYLRLGGTIGDGAVVDHQFGTTDVFVLVSLDRIGERYFQHFDKDETLKAAVGTA